jgi:hypothetical protein
MGFSVSACELGAKTGIHQREKDFKAFPQGENTTEDKSNSADMFAQSYPPPPAEMMSV